MHNIALLFAGVRSEKGFADEPWDTADVECHWLWPPKGRLYLHFVSLIRICGCICCNALHACVFAHMCVFIRLHISTRPTPNHLSILSVISGRCFREPRTQDRRALGSVCGGDSAATAVQSLWEHNLRVRRASSHRK